MKDVLISQNDLKTEYLIPKDKKEPNLHKYYILILILIIIFLSIYSAKEKWTN